MQQNIQQKPIQTDYTKPIHAVSPVVEGMQQNMQAQNVNVSVLSKADGYTPDILNEKVWSKIQENIQANPEGVRNALTEGMTVLTNIEARIKADSRSINRQGINIEASRNTYTDFSSGKADIETVVAAMAGDIRNAIGSGELAVPEMIRLGYILTDIVGDADLAGEYLRPVFAAAGASGDPWRGEPSAAMAGVTPGDAIRPQNDGSIQPRDNGYIAETGVEGYIDSKGVMGDNNNQNIFVGKLKGEDVRIEDIQVKRIKYVKRDRGALQVLRNEFNSSIRKKFLENLAKDTNYLKRAGFSEDDILFIKNGWVPYGWQVHHKLPLDDGGNNDLNNLVLIRNDPYHMAISNYQKSFTSRLKVGENILIDWPIPDGIVFPIKQE